jgi:hypothetical protein
VSSSKPDTSLQTPEPRPSPTGSKMGAEPQALPDDPVSPSSHGLPTSGQPVRKGLSPSEMFEAQHPGGKPGEVKGDTQRVGDVPTIIDQERASPDISRAN